MTDFLPVDSKEIYEEIITSLENGIDEELYPGDERRMFAEALALTIVSLFNTVNETAKQKMLKYATGDVLDALGERTATYRLKPRKASCVLSFSTAIPQTFNIIIPAGTKVCTSNELYFETDKEVVLKAGDLSVESNAESIEGGSIYNLLLPNTINKLVDLIPYVSAVTNITESLGGDNGEPYDTEGDDHFRERIKLSSNKLSTAGPEDGYIYWAMSADPDIINVKIISPAPSVINIIPLMKGGKIPSQETLNKVVEICSSKKVRPLTDLVTASAPESKTFNIDIVCYVTEEKESDVIEAVKKSEGAVDQYILWQTAITGRDINPDQLRKYLLEAGVLRIDVNEPVFYELDEFTVSQFNNVLNIEYRVVTE